MMHQHAKLFLIFLFIPFCLFAQTITSVKIDGNKKFNKSQYIDWIELNVGNPTFPGMKDSISKRISRNLRNLSHYHHSIISVKTIPDKDSAKFSLTIKLDEGHPSVIQNIYFKNLSEKDSLEIEQDFRILTGSGFSHIALEEAISNALSYFETNGFPFAKILIESVMFVDDSLDKEYKADIYLNFVTGEKATIDRVEIIGNDDTADDVIIRNLRLQTGQTYNQEIIDQIPQRLNRLRFFEPVAQPVFYLDSEKKGVLQIKIKEKQTNNFDGIIGYVPPRENIDGYFTGKVNISLRNLFGTGRSAAFRWEQLERESQELEIKYLEPWIFGLPLNIQGGLWQRKQDTTYVQRKLDAAVEFLATEDISASLIFATESTIPNLADSNRFTVYNSSTFSTGFNFKFDTRDDVYAPTKGFYFINTYTFNSKKISGPIKFLINGEEQSNTIQRFEFDAAVFKELFNRQVIAFKIQGAEMQGDDFEISDMYKIGGTNSLRGYREYQFTANRFAMAKLEYRYLLSSRSYAFLFYDTAYLLRNENTRFNIEKNDMIKMGYGLGLNIETGIGILAVSYAMASGTSFSDGLIHFGIVNEF